MARQDNDGLPRPPVNVFPRSFEDDLPHSDKGETNLSSLGNGGTAHHPSSILLPPPPMTLPMSRFPQLERYETTFALLTCKKKSHKILDRYLVLYKSCCIIYENLVPWKIMN